MTEKIKTNGTVMATAPFSSLIREEVLVIKTSDGIISVPVKEEYHINQKVDVSITIKKNND